MQPPQTRFRLRIESGERQGEILPLAAGIHAVGRKAGNDIVLPDGSVSGSHAELRIVGGEARLVDRGSTNGTRLAGRRIQDERLAHGDRVGFGSVKAIFEDLAFGQQTAEPQLEGLSASPPPLASAGDTIPLTSTAAGPGHLPPATVAAVPEPSRGRLQLVLVALALVVAGFFAWRTLGGSSSAGPLRGGGEVATSEPSLPGAVPEDGWQAAPTAPRSFLLDGSFASDGAVGLGVELEGDEWAFSRSTAIDVRARRAVHVTAKLSASGRAVARVGVELDPADPDDPDGAPRLFAWSHGRSSVDGESFETTVDVLPGYGKARVVIAACGEGTVAIDEVTLLETEPRGPAAKHQEYEAYRLGDDGGAAALARGARTLLAVSADAWSGSGLRGEPQASWDVTSTEKGLAFQVSGAPAKAELRWLVNGRRQDLAADSEPWLATLGPDGYRSHAGSIDVEAADSLLLGRGSTLIRIGLPQATHLRGQVSEGTLLASAPLVGSGFELQLGFLEERVAASGLATRAEEAQARGDHGQALAAWSELLDAYPFETTLVKRAEAARAALVQEGLGRVDEVARDVERADFFELAELYMDCRRRAEEIAAVYMGTEVEADARALVDRISGALTQYESASRDRRLGELRAVLQSPQVRGSAALSERVRRSMDGLSDDSSEGGL